MIPFNNIYRAISYAFSVAAEMERLFLVALEARLIFLQLITVTSPLLFLTVSGTMAVHLGNFRLVNVKVIVIMMMSARYVAFIIFNFIVSAFVISNN